MKLKHRNGQVINLRAATAAFERELILKALKQSSSINEAARRLSVTYSILYTMLKRHGIEVIMKTTRSLELGKGA